MKKLTFVLPTMPWQYNHYSDPPLGLLSVASKAREDNFNDLEVSLIDLGHEEISHSEIYAMGGTTLEFPTLTQLARKIKSEHPTSKFIFGGVHADVFLEEYWKKEILQLPFDIICRGEGEATINDALKALDNNKTNIVISQKKQLSEEEFSSLPFPARDLLSAHHYFKKGLTFCDSRMSIEGNSTTIMSSRGCPYTCSFCASPDLHKRKLRFKNEDKIIEELESLRVIYDASEFRAQDDNYPLVLKRAKNLGDFLRDNDFRYRASLRVDEKNCNPEVLSQLWYSGCREVGFGIESADQNVLDLNQKRTTVKRNEEAIRMAKDYGFLVRAFLMSGIPGEDKNSGEKLAEFIDRNHLYLDTVTLTNFIPLPGTDIFNNPEKYQIKILNKNWANYNIAITRNHQKFPFVHEIEGLKREDMMRNLEHVKKAVFNRNLSNVKVYNDAYAGEEYNHSYS